MAFVTDSMRADALRRARDLHRQGKEEDARAMLRVVRTLGASEDELRFDSLSPPPRWRGRIGSLARVARWR